MTLNEDQLVETIVPLLQAMEGNYHAVADAIVRLIKEDRKTHGQRFFENFKQELQEFVSSDPIIRTSSAITCAERAIGEEDA